MGQVPTSLLNHVVAKDYIMLGVTPNDFIKHHGSSEFNLAKLQADFKTICTDYDDPLTGDDKSMAVEFCSKVIYTIGPESRKGVKTTDKVWKLKFCRADSNKQLIGGTLFIATHRTTEYDKNFVSGEKLCVTVKQAGLLALPIFDKLCDLAFGQPNPITLLTPLAGSIFSRDDIPALAKKLGVTQEVTIKVINNSCQSGGQYLDNSSASLATVASIVATRNIKDKDVRDGIIGKTIRQYLMQGKTFNKDAFKAYSEYAHGGVPSELSVDKLLTDYTSYKEASIRSLAKSAGQTTTTSSVPSII